MNTTIRFFLLAFLVATPCLAQPAGGGAANKAVMVSVQSVQKKQFADEVEALGTTRANETVVITPKVTETVREIHFEEGQQVKKDDLLLVLESGEEQADLKASQALQTERQRAFARAQELEQRKTVSTAVLDERRASLKQAEGTLDGVRSRIEDRVIRAPFDGIVGLRNVSVGSLVQPGTRITTVDDLSVIKVDFSVPSIYLEQLKQGLPIVGKTEAFPNREFKGTVQTVDTQIDPITRTVMVRAAIPNPEVLLKPGLLMSVSLMRNPREAIVVPEATIIQKGTKAFVYVIEKDGDKTISRLKEIKTGHRRPGEIEVLSGLAEGEQIIIDGIINLSDGKDIQIKPGT